MSYNTLERIVHYLGWFTVFVFSLVLLFHKLPDTGLSTELFAYFLMLYPLASFYLSKPFREESRASPDFGWALSLFWCLTVSGLILHYSWWYGYAWVMGFSVSVFTLSFIGSKFLSRRLLMLWSFWQEFFISELAFGCLLVASVMFLLFSVSNILYLLGFFVLCIYSVLSMFRTLRVYRHIRSFASF